MGYYWWREVRNRASDVQCATKLSCWTFTLFDIHQRYRHRCYWLWVSSFADDTRVLSGITQQDDVSKPQADLEIIYEWSRINIQILTWTCLIYGVHKFIKYSTSYLSNTGAKIRSCHSVRDLELTTTSDACFKEQMSNICNSTTLKCEWILRTFKTGECQLLMTLWKSLVLPTLDYCSQLWSPSASWQIQCLEKLQ